MAVSAEPACTCGCTDPRGRAAHPVSHALADGDLDRALTLGLLDIAPCPACPPDCVAGLERVQDERRQALAARDRYRQREARRQRVEREQRRMTGVGTAGTATASRNGPLGVSTPVRTGTPTLPAAAAAALARAQAKAARKS